MRILPALPACGCLCVGILPSLLAAVPGWVSTGPDGAAKVVVRTEMTAEDPPPLGVNELGNDGGTDYAAGNLIPGAGFEPGCIRLRHRVSATGTDDKGRLWADVEDGGGMTRWELVTTGYMNGATFRAYRMEDASGNALPLVSDGDDYVDVTNAARYELVAQGTLPEVSAKFPYGGWMCEKYARTSPCTGTRANLSFIDCAFVENGTKYDYVVTAVGDGTDEDSASETALADCAEVSATPQAGLPGGPQISFQRIGGLENVSVRSGDWPEFHFMAVGATGTVTWELLDASGAPVASLAGMTLDPQTGILSGMVTSTPSMARYRIRLSAGNGTVTRDFLVNASWTASVSTAPAAPTGVTAVAGDGYVRLSWNASVTPGVVGYRVYRCREPRASQMERIYLPDGTPALHVGDYLYFTKKVWKIDPSWVHPRVRSLDSGSHLSWDTSNKETIDVTLAPHTVAVPAQMRFAGEGCLKVTSNQTGENTVGGPFIFYPDKKNNGEPTWYGRLEAGKTYRYEAWIREEGMEDPRITLTFGSMYGADVAHTFAVDGEWKLCSFTFTAPAEPTADNIFHDRPVLAWNGRGRFYVDNIRLFRCDSEAEATQLFVPSPWVQEELFKSQPATGRKGMMRSMGVLLNSAPMAKLLTPYADSPVTMDWYQTIGSASNMTLPNFLNYAFLTGSDPATRMRPWLNVSSFSTDEEWAMLCEYLAAPIDPANPADVAAKPWAYLRYQERGVATPWTDEFENIYIEFANETWHNGAVSDQWFGWAKDGWVHGGAKQFGVVANHVLRTLEANSPYYVAAHNAGKLKFVMGSNYSDYAEQAIPGAPLADAIGHTTYVGPRWEVGEAPATVFDDHGVQATLLCYLTDTEPYLDAYRLQREKLHAAGRSFELLGYEGGPSGYSIYSMTAAQEEIVENYGKSQAMAVAALDAWLDSCQKGFSDQGYLCFGQGYGWTSHSPMCDGYRPHVPWLALTLRNRVATGDMIAADVTQSPTLAWDGVEYPLVGSYAFRDRDTLTVFLLSRKLDGVHEGHDFGDGHTAVTLVLPADPVGSATLTKLAGNPRESNRFPVSDTDETTLHIAATEESVTLARETVIDLPPGAIYCYKVKTTLPAAAVPPSRAGEPTLARSRAATQISWDVVPGATGYVLYRSGVADFARGVGSEAVPVAGTSYSDPIASGGTTFYYRVAAVNGWGTGLPSFHAVGGVNASAALLAAPKIRSVEASDGRLWISWGSVPNATGYLFGWSYFSGGPYKWENCAVATSHILTNLANGRKMYFVVLALGTSGYGPQSAEGSGTPVAAGTATSLLRWDFAGCTSYETSVPASSCTLAAEATPFVLGPGMIVGDEGYHPFGDAVGFFPKDDNDNFGAAGGGSLANAVARDLYVAFSLAPREGYSVSLSGLSVPLVTYLDLSVTHLFAALRYRVGNGAWTDLASGAQAVTTANFADTQTLVFDLSGVAALQNARKEVAFRLYFYSTDEYAQWCRVGIGRVEGDDLILNGTAQDVSEGVAAWKSRLFTAQEIASGAADDDADLDGDGISNLVEYALSLNPRSAQASPLRVAASSAGLVTLTLPHNASAHDVTTLLEVSPDLENYTILARSDGGLPFVAALAGYTVTESADGTLVTVATTAPSASPRFYRIRVIR